MKATQAQPHYAPSAVGALMDPGFLRNAVIDASGDRRIDIASMPASPTRWRIAMHAVAAAFRRH